MLTYFFAGFLRISACVWPNSGLIVLCFSSYFMDNSIVSPRMPILSINQKMNHCTEKPSFVIVADNCSCSWYALEKSTVTLSSPCLWGLEWISSHQCTSWGWARWTRFADDHLPARIGFFFPDPPCPKILYQKNSLPPPSYLPPTSRLLPTAYQPHPPSLHRQSSRDLERLWSGSWSDWSWS
jgi:hypothetical protein